MHACSAWRLAAAGSTVGGVCNHQHGQRIKEPICLARLMIQRRFVAGPTDARLCCLLWALGGKWTQGRTEQTHPTSRRASVPASVVMLENLVRGLSNTV